MGGVLVLFRGKFGFIELFDVYFPHIFEGGAGGEAPA